MSFLDKFEHAVERSVNTAFSRVFRSGLKPVDVTTALRRSMDDNVARMSTDRAVSPNVFQVQLSRTDAESLGADLEVLADEFAAYATTYAEQQEYALLGPIEVHFEVSDVETTGELTIDATNKRGSVAPATAVSPSPEHPIIEVEGQRWLLKEEVTVIGRGSESDIIVNDSGVSRRHLELRVTPTGVIATDLGSTNGSFVEGNKIEAATLVDGNLLTIGRTDIMFWTHTEDSVTEAQDEAYDL